MKAVVAAFNQEKALVGAFSGIVQLVVEPMDRFTALLSIQIFVSRAIIETCRAEGGYIAHCDASLSTIINSEQEERQLRLQLDILF